MDALKAAVPNMRSQAGPALAWARNHDKGQDEVSRGQGQDLAGTRFSDWWW